MSGIPISKILEYPRELTDAYWQAKKGVIAKTKSTGLGAELDKAKDLHKKIDTGKLHAGSGGPKNERELQAAYKAALAYFQSTVEPLRHQLHIVRDVAERAQATLKKVPGAGSGAQVAADIAKKAAEFAVLCKSIDMEDPVKDLQARFAVKTEAATKAIKGSLDRFATGFRAYCASEQTPADWNDFLKQQCRALSNALAQLEGYNTAFWPEFEKFKGFDLDTLGLNDETDQSKEKRMKLAKAAANQVSAIAKFKSG